MKAKLIKDYKGIGRKKGDVVDCTHPEFESMVARGYVADPNAKPAKKVDENGEG